MAVFETLDEAGFRAAVATGAAPRAVSARYDRRRQRLLIQLATGLDVAFDPRRVPGLEATSDDELADVGLEGVGGTIRFGRIDADYSVSRLLDVFLRSAPAAA